MAEGDEKLSDAGSDKEALQAAELRFEMQYRTTEQMDKQKELQSYQCLGSEPVTDQYRSVITSKRENAQTNRLESLLADDKKRFETIASDTRVDVPVGFETAKVPEWDEHNNESFNMRLQVIDRFVRAVTKCLMRIRVTNRYNKIMQAIRQNGVTDRKSCAAWVDLENKEAKTGTYLLFSKLLLET